MGGFDTSMGGRQGAFPETVWSSVLSCRDLASPDRATALNRLFERYWRPVYAFIRMARNKPVEEAKDLTQDFFRHLLEWDFVAQYEPAKGRFRHFLKGALRNFLSEAHRDATREKRGGGRGPLSLDVADLETDAFLADARQKSPDELFDRQWRRDVLAGSLGELETALKAEGKEAMYRAYAAYTEDESASYESIGRRLGIPPTQVTHHLHNARARLKEIVRRRVLEYVSSPDEVEGEIRDLFGA